MTLECSLLYVNDLARMRGFYEAVLQAPAVNMEWTDTWALFDTGATKLALHQISGSTGQGIAAPRETSPVKLIFAVDDVPAERARLQALGATAIPRPWQEPSESCDWADPEGNIFQIAARLRLPQLFGQPAVSPAS